MGTHENLDIWKLSMLLVTDIYRASGKYPKDERFGLIAQIRRAAISIPSNIAEGAARKSDKENIQFLYIALGSIAELETQLMIAQNLDFGNSASLLSKTKEIKSKLINYIKYIKSLNK